MAHIRDQWTRPVKLPDGSYKLDAKGRRVRERSDRWGKGKRWLVVYRRPDGSEGQEACSTKPEAEAVKDSLAADVRRGDYVDPRHGRQTFDQLAADWLSTRMVTAGTAERDRQAVDRLTRTFGPTPIGEIRQSSVMAWRKARAREVAPSTVNLELWALHAIMQAAVDDDRIRRNPVAKVDRLAAPKAEFEPWPLDTIRSVIDAHEGRGQVVPILAFGCGLRLGEALGVGVDDLDFLRRRVHVRRQLVRIGTTFYLKTPKRGSSGVVQGEPEMFDALAAVLAEHPPVEVTLPWLPDGAEPGDDLETAAVPLLVVGRRGAPMRRHGYYTGYWYPALARAGLIPPPTRGTGGRAVFRTDLAAGPHHLRHDYGSYRLYEGHPVIAVQAMMRHARLDELINTYAHVLRDAEQTTITDAVASVFRPAPCSASAPSAPPLPRQA